MSSADATIDLQVDDRPARAEVFSCGRAGAPAVLVIHEWYGVVDDVRRICRRWADEGFDAAAVDLYQGQVASSTEEAMRLVTELKTERAVPVMRAAARAMRERGAARVGITGFCLGGGMAIAAACNVEEIAAAAPFYGRPRTEFRRFTASTPPLQGHYAKVDAHVPPEGVREMQEEALAAGASFELFFYDGPHAFMREGDPGVFHEESARLAWSRVVPFMKTHLGGG